MYNRFAKEKLCKPVSYSCYQIVPLTVSSTTPGVVIHTPVSGF